MTGHAIALGGIGGDSHSVGLILLRRMLQQSGFRVLYLGTQNPIEEFFLVAASCDVVMISCVDGHAHHYLRDFPRLIRERQQSSLWYLGGHPMVEDIIGGETRFLAMGFHRVFMRFVELDRILDCLAMDLAGRAPAAPNSLVTRLMEERLETIADGVDDRQMALADHDRERSFVLQHWPTGRGAADLGDNAAWLARRPSLAAAEGEVLEGRRSMLIQPRTGVALPEEQARLFRAASDAGATVLSYQIDSLTRNNNYVEAAEGIRESNLAQFSTINGFPAVNHGVPVLRRVGARVDRPLQVRHSTRDPRLLAEISYGGGVSGFEGGAICYNIPYYKDYPLAEAIARWRYVDRLTARYHDAFGLTLHREFFGVLTGTLVPPCIAIATGVLESVLAAQQGVRAVAIGYAEQGCRAQDVAALRMIPKLAKRILANFGFASVAVGAVFHQYMAAFPAQPGKARQLIRASGTSARLGKATRLLTKTAAEAIRIPSLNDNIEGLSLTLAGIADADAMVLDEKRVGEEADWIEREVTALVDHVVELGRGNVATGIIRAFRAGSLDVPFAPSRYNSGDCITARDAGGAVRFLSCGRLPFSADIVQFHAERMSERRRLSGVQEKQDYRLIEEDLLRIPRGHFETWPLS
ncbi:MAG: methylaspartate mutase subunit E [Alphaproteobacteria bacterium]|nr:methylaspartate mutase subunit E [Alphaproteobacteria bacterium]